MSDFDLRGDSVDVQAIMKQIRARVSEKRGVDYTEKQIRELAAVKLERFLDAKSVRSDLLQQFRAARPSQLFVPFGPDPLFTAHRPLVARLRGWLRPVLRLFFNPDPINDAFRKINTMADHTVADRDQYFELLHNLVLELTRATIEIRDLKMRVDSLSSRLDFDERRARALESAVVYRPDALQPRADDTAPPGEGPGQRSRRLMARRWRRGRPSAAQVMGAAPSDATGTNQSAKCEPAEPESKEKP
jgi:hypothetical protein